MAQNDFSLNFYMYEIHLHSIFDYFKSKICANNLNFGLKNKEENQRRVFGLSDDRGLISLSHLLNINE